MESSFLPSLMEVPHWVPLPRFDVSKGALELSVLGPLLCSSLAAGPGHPQPLPPSYSNWLQSQEELGVRVGKVW